MDETALTETLVGFVREIGLETRPTMLETSFLPGLDVGDGAVLFDAGRLLYPGDILHEAGHLAVLAPDARGVPQLEPDGGDEMAAIAWSYAAALHLGIDPAIVFHPNGYKGSAASILENFTAGRYFGVPLLALYGMTVEPGRAKAGGPPAYPHMLRWLR